MRAIIKIMALLTTLAIIMVIGTVAYHNIEGWNYTDSFYFTGVTVTTVGYGDIAPVTDAGKIFTVFFAFTGIGIALFVITSIAEFYFERQQKRLGQRIERDVLRYARTHRRGISRIRRGIISGKIGRVPISRRRRRRS